ncbi:MAG: KH domain-containing protein [Actinomycetota bacterium]|nr:KH domain-containing protein [Actinomycetota bacterium]
MTRAVLEFVTGWLVDHPEEVAISEVEDERAGTVLEISVHPDDIGKIIGKQGRIIRALRTVARAAAHREGDNVSVEVVD